MKFLLFALAFTFPVLIGDYSIKSLTPGFFNLQIFYIIFLITFSLGFFSSQYININKNISLIISAVLFTLSVPVLRMFFIIKIIHICIPVLIISLTSFFMGRIFFNYLCNTEKKLQFLLISFLITALTSPLLHYSLNALGYLISSFFVSTLFIILIIPKLYKNKKSIISLIIIFIFSILTNVSMTKPIQRKMSNDILYEKQFNRKTLVLIEKEPQKNHHPAIPQHEVYLDSFNILNTSNEHLTQICLINTPLDILRTINKRPKKALILGEELGLGIRNLLLTTSIKSITVVIEKELFSMAKDSLILRMYNLDSMKNHKIKFHFKDPFYWTTKEKFDFIIVNFLPPYSTWYSRFYTPEFYSKIMKFLSQEGILVVKLNSPDLRFYMDKIMRSLNQKAFFYKQNNDVFLITTKNNELNINEYFAKSKGPCKKEIFHKSSKQSLKIMPFFKKNRELASISLLK